MFSTESNPTRRDLLVGAAATAAAAALPIAPTPKRGGQPAADAVDESEPRTGQPSDNAVEEIAARVMRKKYNLAVKPGTP